MTRWDLLRKLMLSPDDRKAIGKAWPLFFFLALQISHNNKMITSYEELKEKLKESPSTIKKWRDHLFEQKVIVVINGRLSMTMILLPPYDSLVKCEIDDMTQVKINSDPATKKLLKQISSYGNMSLFPVVADIASKLDAIEKRLE